MRRKRAKELVENKNQEENFNLDVQEFEAFFFPFMLNEKLKTKGLVEQDREGILTNFFTSKEILQNKNGFNPILILPQHVKLLAAIVNQNK